MQLSGYTLGKRYLSDAAWFPFDENSLITITAASACSSIAVRRVVHCPSPFVRPPTMTQQIVAGATPIDIIRTACSTPGLKTSQLSAVEILYGALRRNGACSVQLCEVTKDARFHVC